MEADLGKEIQNGRKIENSRNIKRIYNLEPSSRKQDLIRNDNLWEIRGGEKALFWQDAWQQRENLFSR